MRAKPELAGVAKRAKTNQRHWMIYVLAYPEFEQPTAWEIDRFRLAHEPERAALVPPHVTLVFGLRHASMRRVLSLCEAAVERVSEIAVTFSGSGVSYDPFEEKYKLCLICDRGKDALVALHEQLYDGAHRAELNSEFPYRPHMTVATDEDPSRIAELDANELGAFPISGSIRSLNVVDVCGGSLSPLCSYALSR